MNGEANNNNLNNNNNNNNTNTATDSQNGKPTIEQQQRFDYVVDRTYGVEV